MDMLKIFKPWVWFRKKPQTVSETEPEKKAEFTTDITRIRAKRKGALDAWIAQNMFQKTHSDIITVKNNENTFDTITMDSDDSLKSAYTLSNGVLPQVLFSWFVQQGFIGYQACAIIAQHWLIDNACTVPAEDAIKNGYEITVKDEDNIDPSILLYLRSFDKKYKLHKNLVGFARFNRVFGIRIALFNVDSDDPNYYSKPFNIDGVKIGSYKGITQIDPYWITPELDQEATANPASPDFYEPTWWRVSGRRYHKSHLILIRHAEVADVLKPSYMYGGLPLTQKIFERVYAAERTANEAPQLTLTKRMNVLKTDTDKAIANQSAFEEKLQFQNEIRDNYGTLVIGEEDEYQQTETTLSELDSVIMTQYQLVASIARTPGTKLLGTSPKGFNATGEFETETYRDLLETIQNDDTKLLERHYELLMKSEGINPFNFEITWKPLKSPTPIELADINQKNATTDQLLQLAGAIDGNDVRNRLISDQHSGYCFLEAMEEIEEDEPELPAEGEHGFDAAQKGYIAFDLDGTLAEEDGWKGISYIGKPIEKTVKLVKEWQDKGYECIIFSARASNEKAISYIKKWVDDNDLGIKIITNKKLPNILIFYDNRNVSVKENVGTTATANPINSLIRK